METPIFVLIGEENSRRTLFLKKAAFPVPVRLLCYSQEKKWEILSDKLKKLTETSPVFCKIDPPSYDFLKEKQYRIDCMYQMAEAYLSWLSSLPAPSNRLHYLNTPETIALLLDKQKLRQTLAAESLPATPLLSADISCYEELKQLMEEKHCFSVFVKPKLASGAAGILAYQYHPEKCREKLYTSAAFDGGFLVNTKRISCCRDHKTIQAYFSKILPLGTIVERWVPKAEYNRKKYDFRILFQFGRISFITVRQSDGPITNLHLNNAALPSEVNGQLPACLSLSAVQAAGIENLCQKAVHAVNGLSMAGIDVLLEKESGKPMLIEMNGQGDLLYQDIYDKNSIYSEQIGEFLTWSSRT